MVSAFVLLLILVVFAFSRMFDPESEFIGPVEGTVKSIIRTPTPGNYASAPSLWEIEVVLDDGQEVTATTRFLPVIGSTLCLASERKGHWGTRYSAVGNVEAMRAAGKSCLNWRPSSDAASG